MAVYIKPPKGNIDFTKLCTFVKRRLVILHLLQGKSVVEIEQCMNQEILGGNLDCLIDGSVKDKISHFVLRFLCSSDFELRTFFIKGETDLFKYRLEFYTVTDLRNVVLDACKQSKKVLQSGGVIKSYRNLLGAFNHLKDEFEATVQRNGAFLKVPFVHALNFVKHRLCPLTSGFLCVPLSDLKNLLVSFFEESVCQGILQTKSSTCIQLFQDLRMSYMLKEIKAWFKFNFSIPTYFSGADKIITEENLNIESQKFPLCMKNIHLLLRKKHRLPHNARIQYILFLKEIGVPYQEVISLFMKEYSLPMCCKNSCNHSWNDSKGRYIYSIQHLYGKQGSRKNYRAHGCNTLQSCASGSVNGGGCPFSCFDKDSLHRSLLSENLQVTDIEDIVHFTDNKKYSEACNYFLNKRTHILTQPGFNLNKIDNKFATYNNNVDMRSCRQNMCDESLEKERESYVLSCEKKHSLVMNKPSEFFFILSNIAN